MGCESRYWIVTATSRHAGKGPRTMPGSDRTSKPQARPSTTPSHQKEPLGTSDSRPGPLRRSLPDGRIVQVWLPGMPGYEQANQQGREWEKQYREDRQNQDRQEPQ